MASKVTLDDSVIVDYKDGKTLKELANTHGCSTSKIAQFLETKGVPRRPRGRKKNLNKESVPTIKNVETPLPLPKYPLDFEPKGAA